jgi:hypothetical protein
MSDLEQELLRIEPEASRMQIGNHAVLHYRTVVPAFSFDTVFRTVGKSALEVCARSGFSFDIAQRVLDFAIERMPESLRSDAITVLDGFDCARPGFETVILVPPAIARRYETSGSAKLADATIWAIPGYRCELQDGHSREDFEFCYSNRGAKIKVVEWDRKPTPQVRIQLLTEWPGGSLRKRRKPGVMSLDYIVSVMHEIPKLLVEVRVVDFKNRELDLRLGGSAIEYRIRDGEKTKEGNFSREDISEHLRRFAMGGELG